MRAPCSAHLKAAEGSEEHVARMICPRLLLEDATVVAGGHDAHLRTWGAGGHALAVGGAALQTAALPTAATPALPAHREERGAGDGKRQVFDQLPRAVQRLHDAQQKQRGDGIGQGLRAAGGWAAAAE